MGRYSDPCMGHDPREFEYSSCANGGSGGYPTPEELGWDYGGIQSISQIKVESSSPKENLWLAIAIGIVLLYWTGVGYYSSYQEKKEASWQQQQTQQVLAEKQQSRLESIVENK